jgi:hypothetical protein
MIARPSTSRPGAPATAVVATLLAVLALPLGGCTGGPDGAGCPAPQAAAPAEVALLPEGLSFDAIGTVTRVVSTEGHLNVRAVTDRPLDEVTVLVQDAVTAAGYRPAGMDNEGFEAEVFFTSGTYAAGQALVRRADCEGRWDIDLVLVDPSAVPGSTGPTSPPATT